MQQIKSIVVEGLYGRLDVDVIFKNSMTILYGKNGAAKTTLLHIIANLSAGNIERFAFLKFKSIRVILSTGELILLERFALTDGSNAQYVRVLVDGKSVVSPFPVYQVQTHMRGVRGDERRSKLLGQIRTDAEQLPLNPATYFPAFRPTLEAWSGKTDEMLGYGIGTYLDPFSGSYPRRRSDRRFSSREEMVTAFARDLFGDFVPVINYPSPQVIESELTESIRESFLEMSVTDRAMLTNAFADVFDVIGTSDTGDVESADHLVQEIVGYLDELAQENSNEQFDQSKMGVYEQLRDSVNGLSQRGLTDSAIPFLKVYRESLRQRVEAQTKAFEKYDKYVSAVNEFFEGKEVGYQYRAGLRFGALYLDLPNGETTGLKSLSSGERQILSLLYATVYHDPSSIVLIDEPEISLHIDWQRMLLRKMARHLEDRQIIVCTHSPEIGALFLDSLVEISPVETSLSAEDLSFLSFDDEKSGDNDGLAFGEVPF